MRKRGKKNIQAANRREEERQAGCHTSKTGTQLQQTAEITGRGGKRNRRCERHRNKDKDRNRFKVFTASQIVHAVSVGLRMDCTCVFLRCNNISNGEDG